VTSINDLNQFQYLPKGIDLVEVRADLIGSLSLNPVQKSISKVFVLKSVEEGGSFKGTLEERQQYLIKAAETYDYVELEGERDLIPEILNHIPIQQRRISWEGLYTDEEELTCRLWKYQNTSALLYKMVVKTRSFKEAVVVSNLVKKDISNRVVAYAKGVAARFTQVLPPFLGASEVHCDFYGDEMHSAEQLQKIYGLPYVYDTKELYGIVGNPVINSISPELHNKAYRSAKLPFIYVPFTAENFRDFCDNIILNEELPIPLKGLTVVSPFKKEGVLFSEVFRSIEKASGEACNGLVFTNNGWEHFSTDTWGALQALKTVDRWEDKRIAIVGMGGTGQTIAKTLRKLNIALTLVNRTIEKGKRVARELSYPFIALEDFDASHFDIIIHATPLGKKKGEVPFDLNKLKHQCLVVDHVYPKTDKSELVKYCELFNINVIDGITIAGIQIEQQFQNMTFRNYPEPENKESKRKLKIN
jgi:3-dehydroquinate dehydratase/shikimate dehydrogenase